MCHWNGSAGTVACKHVKVYTQLLESRVKGEQLESLNNFRKGQQMNSSECMLYIYICSRSLT